MTEKPEMFDLSTIRVPDARWESNGNLPSQGDGDWRCIVCNRGVNTESKGVVWVHMSEDWNAYPNGTTEEIAVATEGDMGYHPVGANCAKKVPANYR